ncbi:PREDICTED: hyoscyamine 6-dioxygenase-like [Nicotiana attenuata]|uniref:Protein downy mildew resistance 6 n=1 Tax=Nicotiana attenuata TaxID=49451 RepID=A0A1J6ILA8_NICAT|nr:PREDICTED: hyoscyamine 6-dioxygenase-like [Nicotiana attenuata]OIS95944.1 protein downy mildew resistance 6 [Nicotiana attenuata]
MEVLISNWSNVESVPKTYIFPLDSRPGKLEFPVCNNIPVIDLDQNHPAEIIQQVISACQKFGFFQVINHGVSENLMDETMNMYKEFFKLPSEYKAKFYSNDINKSCRIYSSTLSYDNEEFHYWRDNFTHRCHPLEEYIQSWPDKPTKYREVIGEYTIETRKLLYRILEMICKGLGLESGYFEGEISKTHLISVNHHIPCPDPSLTLGMPVHSDPNLITLLHQCDVPGLQILKDGEWIGVNPVPDSLIVIPGLQLKVISNDTFITPVHRVVTHAKEARTTIGVFLGPSPESLIKPATTLVSCSNMEPVFRAFTYPEFFKAFSAGAKCDAQVALNHFRIKP